MFLLNDLVAIFELIWLFLWPDVNSLRSRVIILLLHAFDRDKFIDRAPKHHLILGIPNFKDSILTSRNVGNSRIDANLLEV